jgi:hypothetical protein
MKSLKRALLLLPWLWACGAQLVEFDLDAGAAPPNHDGVRSLRVSAQSVEAPDYVLELDALSVLTDVNGIVQSATGDATLTAGSVPGQSYVVVDAADLHDYAEIDAAYRSATSAALTLDVPAQAFALVDDDLSESQPRTLIIANLSNGVRSYQAFEIMFHAVR